MFDFFGKGKEKGKFSQINRFSVFHCIHVQHIRLLNQCNLLEGAFLTKSKFRLKFLIFYF